MIIDNNNIREILTQLDLRPSKDKGQNYLINNDVDVRITSLLEIDGDDKILEIGPGLGSITHYLVETNVDVDVVDIDSKTCDFLEYVYKNNANLHIFNENALKFKNNNYNKIISNLPYSITSDLLEHLLLNFNASKYVFMCQSEVFTRLYSLKGSEYCPLSVLINLLGDIKKEFNVSLKDFCPCPKCGSTVFSITKKTNELELVKDTYYLVKKLFLNRRQTILNNLTRIVNNKDYAKTLLEKCNININDRPENILPIKYLELTKLIKE